MDMAAAGVTAVLSTRLADALDEEYRISKHTRMKLLEMQCQLKEMTDYLNNSMAEENAHVRDWLQACRRLQLQCYDPIEPQDADDFCTGNTRSAAAAAGQVDPNTKLVDNLRKECWRRIKERGDCFDIAMAEEKGPLRDWLQGILLLQCYRFSSDNYLCGELVWNVRYKIIKGICLGLQYLHDRKISVIHVDLKPGNILLDYYCDRKISGFGATRLLHDSHNITARKVGSIGTLYSPSYVEFAVEASTKGGAVIKIGSHVIHVPKYLSVHHPLVQMVLFPRTKFADTFACCESMAPKSIFDMAKRLLAFALSNWWKTDWNLARPKSGSHPSDTGASGAVWIAATAAPHHATGNRNLLAGFIIEHDDLFVHAVDGVPRKVLARGAVVTDSVVLPDVWFVPGLTENLVSVSQLVDLDHSVGFSCGKCCIRRTDGKVVGKGRLQEGGIYVLDFLKVPLAI